MLPLKKLDSTVVCSTHTYESTVIKESITKLWPLVRGVNLDKLLPSSVKNQIATRKSKYFFLGFKGCMVRRRPRSSWFKSGSYLD